MARTQGHGNPKWDRDETILALALYFECDGKIPSLQDERVQELSALLQRHPRNSATPKKESFRNPDGVRFKLQNLGMIATGKGLANISKMDRKVWREFGSNRDLLTNLANQIRDGLALSELPQLLRDYMDSEEFFEGRILTQIHKRKERNPELRKRLLALRRRTGTLTCDMCGRGSQYRSPVFTDAIFEAHHLLPLSTGVERLTRLKDMALLCANCHRLLHRAISIEKRWLSVAEGKKIAGLPD